MGRAFLAACAGAMATALLTVTFSHRALASPGDGTSFMHHGDAITGSGPVQVQQGNVSVPQPQTAVGYEEAVGAHAYVEEGDAAYTYLEVEWVVPAEPINNDNNSMLALYPAILSCSNQQCSGSSVNGILQPVVAWNWGGSGLPAHVWSINTTAEQDGVNSCGANQNGYYCTSGFEQVYVGDVILGVIWYQTSGSWAGYWYVEAYDLTTGAYTYQYWRPGSNGFWSAAYAGTLEAYGTQNESSLPASCNDFPASGGDSFIVLQAQQWFPSEGSFAVTPDWLLYHYSEQPSSCLWGQATGTFSSGPWEGYQYAQLSW